MQPQLPLVHQFLDKVSNEQHPGHHQHQRKDIRDGLQVPGEYRRSNCQCCCKKTPNHCQQWQTNRPITKSSVWWGGDNRVQILLMSINPSIFFSHIKSGGQGFSGCFSFFFQQTCFSQQLHQALNFRQCSSTNAGATVWHDWLETMLHSDRSDIHYIVQRCVEFFIDVIKAASPGVHMYSNAEHSSTQRGATMNYWSTVSSSSQIINNWMQSFIA